MEREKAIELVIKLLRAQGMDRVRLKLPSHLAVEESPQLFMIFQRGAMYLVELWQEKSLRELDFLEEERLALQKMLREGKLSADRVFLLRLLIGEAEEGASLPLPELEGEVIELYWRIDTQAERLIIPDGQMTSFLELEKSLPELLKEQVVEDYAMKKSQRLPYLTYGLIALNALIWLWLELSGGSEQTETLLRMGAMSPLLMLNGEWYRLITSMFLHIGLLHLLMNSAGIFIFGTRLEGKLFLWEMLLIYLGGGIIGNCASLAYHLAAGVYQVVGAGASGGVYALMGALLTVTYLTKKRAGGLDAYAILIYFMIGLAAGAMDMQIDLAAHLGGFLAGVLLALPFVKKRRVRHE